LIERKTSADNLATKNSTVNFRPKPGRLVNPAADAMERLGVDASSPFRLIQTLPFSLNDVSVGTENEFQAVVEGHRDQVDLPLVIQESNYFKNLIKRHRRGELPKRMITDLEDWLDGNDDNVWENAWVRFPLKKLNPLTRRILNRDLMADKSDSRSGVRNDSHRFLFRQNNKPMLRVPVSYLLKLALTDAISDLDENSLVKADGLNLSGHFLCDNTSPEVFSFYLTRGNGSRLGQAAAEETGLRFLFTQLLVQYANQAFGLKDNGQRVKVYFAPHPPVRQKELNTCISDTFYRELFMNPCLSGWDKGEEKHRYMHLCHQVLSRAQISALYRLKEAGIISHNLVVLPSASNISLANNGTHVSIGSHRLTKALSDPASGFTPKDEKYCGDLAIKFVEHFLPLFVGTYSAAPYRLDFSDFHPERVLSFLPYQLDYTHLRMIWRRWRKKARLKARLFGFRLTPFGPPIVDNLLSRLFNLRGDLVPDFRLLDYLVAVMSTDQCPALDGSINNQARLKKDLCDWGAFDPAMPVYMLYRQREYGQMGFSGFEGRYYSLFPSLMNDLAPAVSLQNLITALAYQLMAKGALTHADIPDRPETESERRQIFFGAAIGLPTFFVRADTPNLVMRQILECTPGIRLSKRYPGYVRVRHHEFRQGLIRFLKREAVHLIEALNLTPLLDDLYQRITDPEDHTASSRLTKSTLDRLNLKSPFSANGDEFNQAAEAHYRDALRLDHLEESWRVLENDASLEWHSECLNDPRFREALYQTLNGLDARAFVRETKSEVFSENADPETLKRLIRLVVLVIHHRGRAADIDNNNASIHEVENAYNNASIHQQAHR
jgi:hypothetical protein